MGTGLDFALFSGGRKKKIHSNDNDRLVDPSYASSPENDLVPILSDRIFFYRAVESNEAEIFSTDIISAPSVCNGIPACIQRGGAHRSAPCDRGLDG